MGAIKRKRVIAPYQVVVGIRRVGTEAPNMQDIRDVATIAYGMGETVTMFWIWLNREKYLRGIKNGFKGIKGLKTSELLLKFNGAYKEDGIR